MIISGSVGLKPSQVTGLSRLKMKVNIATPAYGGAYCSEYVHSLYQLLSRTSDSDLSFSLSDIDYADIVLSRNYLVSNFYYHKTDCTHLLFVDSDMGFDVGMIHQMLALNEPIVGALYPRRQMDMRQLHAFGNLPFEEAYQKALTFVGSVIQPYQHHAVNSGFVKAKALGTGILLISRESLTKMVAQIPSLVVPNKYPIGEHLRHLITPFNKLVVDGRELSEDLSFCHRWTEHCQGSLYASVKNPVSHVGRLVISGQFDMSDSASPVEQ